tara:strand:+ start:595 stop:1206 length:612 start_codon:yes stop_codon:yes gene_type:complete
MNASVCYREREKREMNKIAMIAGMAVVATGATADVLLEIDLSTANQVTISATSGLASQSASTSTFTGFLLADFFATPGAGFGGVLGADSGDLTTFNNPSDGTPSGFVGSSSVGLNIWSFSSDSTVTVDAGAQAFSGSATWTLDALQYADFLDGATSGDIYFGADTDDDIGNGAILIGQYNVVPAPSALALLGMGGMVATRRRR